MKSIDSKASARIAKLVRKSNECKFDPFDRLEYQERLAPDRLQFPEQLLSLYHDEVYGALSDEQKWRLSLLETVNFFSLNIHGERALIGEVMARIHQPARLEGSVLTSDYAHHLVHEENAHSYMLSRYCYAYADGVMPDMNFSIAKPNLSRSGHELLFHARTYVLETFLAYLNVRGMQDSNLDVTVRTIHELHHVDEARHIAWDRINVGHYLEELKRQAAHDEIAIVHDLTVGYRNYVASRLCNPNIYRTLGIPDAMAVYTRLKKDPARLSVLEAWLARADELLQQLSVSTNDG